MYLTLNCNTWRVTLIKGGISYLLWFTNKTRVLLGGMVTSVGWLPLCQVTLPGSVRRWLAEPGLSRGLGPGRRPSWGGRQHNNTSWHAGCVWWVEGVWRVGYEWGTGSSDSLESESRFPDVLWSQTNKRKRDSVQHGPELQHHGNISHVWKSKASDLWKRAHWPTLVVINEALVEPVG